jgi:hypothetical protein
MAARGGRGGSSDAFGIGGSEGAGSASRPDPFAVSQPVPETREETDEEIVSRLSKQAAPKAQSTAEKLTGSKEVFVGGKTKKSDNPLTPFKNLDGSYIDKRTGTKLPKEKWKSEWDGLNGAQTSAPAPGSLSRRTTEQVATVRSVRAKASKGGYTPSMTLMQLGGAIASNVNKLHSFAGTIPTTFHNYYGSQTADHVRSAFAALGEAQGSLAKAQANSKHSPGMAGNHAFDAAMSLHKALGHLTQPAIYRRHGRVPEGVTHDTTEGLISAAAEHSYGVSAAKPANLFSLAGKDYDLDKPEHLNALVKKIPTMTPEQKDIIVTKVRGAQPSTIKPHVNDPEFAKKTGERAEEQESITQGVDTVASPRSVAPEKVETGRGNKARKGNVGSVVDVRQASRFADGTMPAGGTSIGRRTAGVGVVNTNTAAQEAERANTEVARRGKLSEEAAAEKEAAAKRQAFEDSKPKPERGPRKKATPKPKAAAVPTKSLTIDQIFGTGKKRGAK